MNYMCMPGMPQYRGVKRPAIVSKVERDLVILSVLEHFKTNLEEITKVTRLRPIVYKRQVMMYFLVNMTHETYVDIGRLFNKDHTTVIHNKDHIRDLITVDEQVKNDVEEIRRKIIDAHY